jgi:hypothetical protein
VDELEDEVELEELEDTDWLDDEEEELLLNELEDEEEA